MPCPRQGQKGKRAPGMVPFPPLDSPKPSFEPLSKAFAAKRGERGLGSVRRFAFGTLLCPEFPLRDLPRMTVRDQTVQGGGVPLRKAPLRSSVDPWSTKRPCGPLAFRRATVGSRVRGKMWGCQEGIRNPEGVLAPSCLRRQTAAMPRHVMANIPRPGGPFSPPAAHRCIGGDKPSAEGKEKRPHCLRQQNCNYIPFKEGVSHRYVNPC